MTPSAQSEITVAKKDLLKLVTRMQAPLAAMRGVHLGRDSSALSIISICDSARVEQKRNDLLVRAIERTPRGGVVSVRIDGQSARETTALSVRGAHHGAVDATASPVRRPITIFCPPDQPRATDVASARGRA
jgi:hypothetical protein